MTGDRLPPEDLEAAAAAAAAADAAHRIETAENPNPRVDYLVLLESDGGPEGTHVALRYVPDKLVVRAAAFRAYLDGLEDVAGAPNAPERLALRILHDLNDEVIPRWIQITVTAQAPGAEACPAAGDGHRVLVEDKQPKWENAALIAQAGGI